MQRARVCARADAGTGEVERIRERARRAARTPRSTRLSAKPARTDMAKTALVAVGGNSLIRAGEKGTIAEQLANARRTAAAIRRPDPAGLPPGHHARQRAAGGRAIACAPSALPTSRTARRWMFAAPPVRARSATCWRSRCKTNLQLAGLDVPVVSVVTQTVVSPDDPAMQHPSKPIGPFYSRADAEERNADAGLADCGRCGARLSARRALARADRDRRTRSHPRSGRRRACWWCRAAAAAFR